MADYNLFEKKEFNCLTKRQKDILIQVNEMTKGKTAAEAAGIIMKIVPMLEKEGQLTNEQKKAITLCILESMTEEERARVLTVFRFAGIV